MGYDARHLSIIKAQGKTRTRMVVLRQLDARSSIFDVLAVGRIRLKLGNARKSSRSLQYFRCQRLGHVAANYHCPASCVFFSESHEVEDYPAKLINGKKLTCLLCGESHVVSYSRPLSYHVPDLHAGLSTYFSTMLPLPGNIPATKSFFYCILCISKNN